MRDIVVMEIEIIRYHNVLKIAPSWQTGELVVTQVTERFERGLLIKLWKKVYVHVLLNQNILFSEHVDF